MPRARRLAADGMAPAAAEPAHPHDSNAQCSAAPRRAAADDPRPYANAPQAGAVEARPQRLGRGGPRRMGAAPISVRLVDHDFVGGNALVTPLIIMRVSASCLRDHLQQNFQGDPNHESFK
ncbi:hypothetical protein E4A48_01610 [Xanthomonas cerealis pv. cerealis]|uniref:Uncharacterized protein n=1 Tax=Xanthomonas cerealis pv. cerealis TaxID=152263 RepID=A0A514E985_9XANT|nr:hypothetical protein [Xanthomonas translucens]QDI02570.1 hypothetical protein E4A48_01610 [Xanthomonas translucens pv. cerealis]UKE70347.1 hypothetical protein K8O61_04665 [Xanthomonas translucens pv. pistacia]